MAGALLVVGSAIRAGDAVPEGPVQLIAVGEVGDGLAGPAVSASVLAVMATAISPVLVARSMGVPPNGFVWIPRDANCDRDRAISFVERRGVCPPHGVRATATSAHRLTSAVGTGMTGDRLETFLSQP